MCPSVGPSVGPLVGPSIGPSVRWSVHPTVHPSVTSFFWRAETKTANDLCRVSGLVYLANRYNLPLSFLHSQSAFHSPFSKYYFFILSFSTSGSISARCRTHRCHHADLSYASTNVCLSAISAWLSVCLLLLRGQLCHKRSLAFSNPLRTCHSDA